MRCIEIDEDRQEAEGIGRLIETWDVLKFVRFRITKSCKVRLIETWDVLK